MAQAGVVLGAFALTGLVAAPPVIAHPSDPDTLTVDLLLDSRGLVFIDGAANRGGANLLNDHRPKKHERYAIAVGVLKALNIPRSEAAVEARMSRLYHQVGFAIYLVPVSTAGPQAQPQFSFESAGLQRLAERHGIHTVKVEVCPAEDRVGPLVELDVKSSTQGEQVAPATDRECAAWLLSAADRPITATAKPLQPPP